MKEQPILFKPEMVRAILDGRKSQTRRIIKGVEFYFACITGDCPHDRQQDCDEYMRTQCPHGKIGDRLWVSPSIHMPRCSRINLEITDVRFQLLHKITDDQAVAEGLTIFNEDDANLYYSGTHSVQQWPKGFYLDNPKMAFRSLWESINGAKSWGLNPWVWIIEFKMVEV